MQTDTSRHSIAAEPSATSVSTDALITLLSDDHAREISTAIVDEAKTAREIVSECDGSRTTVYRRLNRLEDAGLLTTHMRYDANGHHRTTYQLRFESLSIHLETSGLNCAVESTQG
jgi:response regulator of citrate/malate metabolism